MFSTIGTMAAIADTKIETAPTMDQTHENGTDQAIKDEPEYLRGWALMSLAGALMAGSFLLALDHAVICKRPITFPFCDHCI
jgi:hypothetical protein